jgi:hypothetical protein
MPKSFIKIKPITANSEKHNTRKIEPKYLITPSAENISFGDMTITEKRTQLEKIAKEKTGRKMQKKATPIREAVILLPDDNNELNVQALGNLSDELEKRYNIKTFQVHIHNDEGYINEKGEAKYNYHAHLVFDWMDHETGKSLKLGKDQMSEIQTLTAEALSMERGVKGSKNMSLNHHEFRGFLEIKEKLEKELRQELTKAQEHKVREEIIQKRDNENKRRNGSRTIR